MGAISFAMYGVNFLFWMMGATMLGVGIWMAVDDDDAREALAVAGLNEDLYWTSVYFMIATGVFVFIVAFLGMWGAMKGAKWALFGYIGILGLAMIVQLNVIILTGIFWDSIDNGMEENMRQTVKLSYVSETATDDISSSWNNMQTDFKCCGSTCYKDYDGSDYQVNYQEPVPWTCCVMKEVKEEYLMGDVLDIVQCREHASTHPATSQYLNMQGCYPAMKDHLEEHSAILIALTCTFAILEIAGVILAFLLVRKGGRDD